MLGGLVLAAVSAGVVALGWWALAGPKHRWRGRPAEERRREHLETPDGEARVSNDRVPELTTEWADRAQIWAALRIENALLADRLAGRLGREAYRGSVVALAWECEPARDDQG